MLPEELVFTGTNYLPSFLHQIIPTLFWLLLVVSVVAFLQQMTPGNLSYRRWGAVLLLTAVLGGVLYAVLLQRFPGMAHFGLSYVVVEPSGMLPTVPNGEQIGDSVVVGTAGEVGHVRVIDNTISISGLERAGQYSGVVDLNPVEDEGSVSLTVNIADWWLYAFLTLAAGVTLGFGLTSYFKKQRPVNLIRLEAAGIWQELVTREFAFRSRHRSQPLSGYVVMHVARQAIDTALGEVAHDFDQQREGRARDHLQKLADYLLAAERLRRELPALSAELTDLRQHHQQSGSQVPVSELYVARDIDPLLHGSPFPEDDYLHGDSAELQKVLLAVTKAKDNVENRLGAARHVYSAIQNGEELLSRLRNVALEQRSWPGEAIESLAAQIDLLKDSHAAVLRAQDEEAVDAALKNALQGANQIDKLVRGHGRPDAVEMQNVDLEGALRRYGRQRQTVAPPPALGAENVERITLHPQQFGEEVTVDDPVGIRVDLTAVQGAASPLQLRLFVNDRVADELTVSDAMMTSGEALLTFIPERTGMHTVRLQDQAGTVLDTLTVSVQADRSRRWRNQLTLSDTQATLISGLLAVASGLVALYVPQAAWGSNGDYLTALLWGSGISEGAKFVAGLVQGN